MPSPRLLLRDLQQALNKIFDCLIDSYVENQVGLADNFLSVALAAHLKENLIALFAAKQLKMAGIGNNAALTHDLAVRKDQIYWLDPAHNDVHENAFFALMDNFVAYLNRTCYTGITGYEFHYALYEKGSFYKRHFDQFRDDKSRAFSIVMYLNADWQEKDAGELCVYLDGRTQLIAPTNGKCVFFNSSLLEHEVRTTQKNRMSITGWLKTSQ